MLWHTNVTIGDLHYLRSKFAQSQGHDSIVLNSFIQATEYFYKKKQFAVNGECFLTWAFLTPQWETDYLLGNMGWIDHSSLGNPWVVEAYAPKMILSALRQLQHLSPANTIRFRIGKSDLRRIRLPGLTEETK